MQLKEITVRHMRMRLKAPFVTSLWTTYDKEFLLVEAKDENGLTGWGESVALPAPWYSEETCATNWHMLEDFLIPMIFEHKIEHPDQVSEIFKPIRKNNMAKAGLEGAVWDLYAQRQGVSLAAALGGTRSQIDVGISIGIQESVDELLRLVETHVEEGYKRIKVKIKPGWDVTIVKEIRKNFPNISLMVDANSAYTLDDIDHLKQLDAYNLLMIEQPLAADDIIDHAKLQAELNTPICLDESIHSVEDARKALELGSCKIINIKVGRVGGLTESKKIHDLAVEQGVDVWCGGMLEAGVGRAHNIAVTTLANFTLPGDTASSSRYWEEDIVEPNITVENGVITVPEAPGLGFHVKRDTVEKFTVKQQTYSIVNA
ncbi:o-succinylbenzoate synthase [Bacillus tianshenii]|nr:o-succinylbenzoate synthase [Bacillus tianshenii]